MFVKSAAINIMKRSTTQNMTCLTYLQKKYTSDNSCELKSDLKIDTISSVTLIRKINLESNNFQLQ